MSFARCKRLNFYFYAKHNFKRTPIALLPWGYMDFQNQLDGRMGSIFQSRK